MKRQKRGTPYGKKGAMHMVESTVKNSALVQVRRDQIIQSALSLFKEKGFHKTTTREIATVAGFSIGTLYEYIRTKEDVLYLVYESIYEQVSTQMTPLMKQEHPTIHDMLKIVESYFHMMHEMQEEVILLYQEMKSLPAEKRTFILKQERALIRLFTEMITEVAPMKLAPLEADVIANNIFIQGQMWGFRRWALQKQFTFETYVSYQLTYIKRALHIKDL